MKNLIQMAIQQEQSQITHCKLVELMAQSALQQGVELNEQDQRTHLDAKTQRRKSGDLINQLEYMMSDQQRIKELEQKLKLVEEIIQQAIQNPLKVGDLTGGALKDVLDDKTLRGITRYGHTEAVIIPIHLLRRYIDG